jgi:hypothetical protein
MVWVKKEWRREVPSGSFDTIGGLLDSIIKRATLTANHHPSFVKKYCKINNEFVPRVL